MTNFKGTISPSPRAVDDRRRRETIAIPLLAACFMAALLGSSGALARHGAESGAVAKPETASAFVWRWGASALETEDLQPAVSLVAQTPGAIVVAPWSPPPGDTGMELLPAPSDPPIAQNGAGGLTRPGATRATEFTLSASAVVTQVMTYHYGATNQPGTISLQHDDGTIYGPWRAAGAVGQGGVKNAYWWAQPNVELKAGHYIVVDSDPATWSVEIATQGAGIFTLWGHSN
jgi:hypothetical protein